MRRPKPAVPEGASACRAEGQGSGGDSLRQAPAIFRAGLWFLVWAVAVGGFALLGTGALTMEGADWRALLVLAALAVLAERFDFSLYGDSRVSLAFVPIFAAAVLEGFAGLAFVVPPAILASALGSGRPLHKTLFNFGSLMLAGGVSVLILEGFGSAGRPDTWPQVLGPALLAAGANFAVNSGLVAAAIGLSGGISFRAAWGEHFGWLWPHYLVLGLLGLTIAAAYTAMGLWGIAVFLAPPAMMRLSLKQYLDRTTESVLRLRRAHEELQAAHARVTETMAGLQRAYEGTLRSLVAALDTRDSETKGHSERVAELTMEIAREMGIRPESPQWQELMWGALLHDVGKIGVPDHVLRKRGELSLEEWRAIQAHPLAGYEILRSVEFLRSAAEVVLCHHERYDGTGYPRGLAGEEIPLGARIFAVADAFDAMTSERPYRRPVAPEEALAEIIRNSGTQFDPAVVRAFLGVYQKRILHSGGRGLSRSLSEAIERVLTEAVGLGRGEP